METVCYSNLVQMMAKYKIKTPKLAEIIGKSYRQTYLKLHKSTTPKGKVLLFDIAEAGKITAYFKSLGEENATMDYLFFDEMVTKETKTA